MDVNNPTFADKLNLTEARLYDPENSPEAAAANLAWSGLTDITPGYWILRFNDGTTATVSPEILASKWS